MKSKSLASMAVTLALAVSCGTALAQQKSDPGKREYDANCASCHGIKGKGDGPNKPYLTTSPPDLTVLARNNRGVLPVDRLYQVIEGSREAPGHGSRDMPVWGLDYRMKAAEYYGDVAYDPDVFVRAKILALIDYLNRIQVK